MFEGCKQAQVGAYYGRGYSTPGLLHPGGIMLASLLGSRKFLIMLVDVFGSTLLYFVSKYAAPSIVDDIKFLIAAYQPVIFVLIGAIAHEDAAYAKAAIEKGI
jgi:hypothetical protein